MVRVLKRFVLLAAAAYVGICALLFLFQRRLVYFPGAPPGTTPADHGLEHEDLSVRTSDGVELHVWHLHAPEPRGVVLICHGNAGNIEHRLPAARAFLGMGWSVLLFDYRGYGNSEGKPSEEGTYLDAEAVHDYLVDAAGFSTDRIAVYGESLGGAVAIELARRRDVACVVVESTFLSLPAIGAEVYPWLPVRLLSRFEYDSASKVAELGVPLMVVHSPDDELVPFAHGRELFESARDPKTFLATGGGHNDGGVFQRGQWVEGVGAFLDAALP